MGAAPTLEVASFRIEDILEATTSSYYDLILSFNNFTLNPKVNSGAKIRKSMSPRLTREL